MTVVIVYAILEVEEKARATLLSVHGLSCTYHRVPISDTGQQTHLGLIAARVWKGLSTNTSLPREK